MITAPVQVVAVSTYRLSTLQVVEGFHQPVNPEPQTQPEGVVQPESVIAQQDCKARTAYRIASILGKVSSRFVHDRVALPG